MTTSLVSYQAPEGPIVNARICRYNQPSDSLQEGVRNRRRVLAQSGDT
jgi:hypothetical protein